MSSPFFAKKYIAPTCFYSCSYIIYNMLREVVGCLLCVARLRIWGVGGVLLRSSSCENASERAAVSERVCVSSCSRTGHKGRGICFRASRQNKQHIQASRQDTSLLLLICYILHIRANVIYQTYVYMLICIYVIYCMLYIYLLSIMLYVIYVLYILCSVYKICYICIYSYYYMLYLYILYYTTYQYVLYALCYICVIILLRRDT